jgi:hypothetical protein
MRRLSVLIAAALILCSPAGALAQQQRQVITIPADINYFGLYYPQSSVGFFSHRSMDQVSLAYSARSVAMGGTRLATTDDATAIAANPAALSRLPGTVWAADGYTQSGSGTASGFPSEFSTPFGPLPVNGMVEKPGSRTTYGFLGAARPFIVAGRTAVFGLGYRRFLDTTQPLETTVEFSFEASGGQSASTILATVVEESGGLDAVAPSVGFSVIPGVSLGATANILVGKLTSNNEQTVTVLGLNVGHGQGSVSQTYGGFAMTLGALAEFGNKVSIGATVTPKYTIRFRDGKYYYLPIQTDQTQVQYRYQGVVRDYDLEVPLFAGAGIAVRPIERLLVAADYYYRPWSDARLVHGGDAADDELLHETILPWNAGDDFWGETRGLDDIHGALSRPLLEDANSFHVGAEYALLHRHLFGVPYTLPVRAGYHTTPQTYRGVDAADTLSIGQDGDGLYRDKQVKGDAITGGFGITMEQVSFDLSYRRTQEKLTRWFLLQSESVASPAVRRVGTASMTRNRSELRLTTTIRF